jgi:hypothetical protein
MEWRNIAAPSPSQYPTEIIPIIRSRFSKANTKKPETKTNSFLNMELWATIAKKVPNMTNAINEYIPEHGKSTENEVGMPAAVVRTKVGAPLDVDKVTGTFTPLRTP